MLGASALWNASRPAAWVQEATTGFQHLSPEFWPRGHSRPPSTRDAETGGQGVQSQPGLHSCARAPSRLRGQGETRGQLSGAGALHRGSQNRTVKAFSLCPPRAPPSAEWRSRWLGEPALPRPQAAQREAGSGWVCRICTDEGGLDQAGSVGSEACWQPWRLGGQNQHLRSRPAWVPQRGPLGKSKRNIWRARG